MKQLKNIQHDFDVAKGNVGVTIRKGSKWYDVSLGTEMELRVCPAAHDGECNSLCTDAGRGTIIGHWRGAFASLPPSLVSIEHNKDARDIEKLRSMLDRAYGSFTEEDMVTALIYIRTE